MLNSVQKAAENFCSHQMGMECESLNAVPDEKMYIAYIDVSTGDDINYRIYLAANSGFIQSVTTLFLDEQESDDETLKDVMLETANLVIGSAKVLAQESDQPYEIATPHFKGIAAFTFACDEITTLSNDNNNLTIAIKELHANE